MDMREKKGSVTLPRGDMDRSLSCMMGLSAAAGSLCCAHDQHQGCVALGIGTSVQHMQHTGLETAPAQVLQPANGCRMDAQQCI